MDRETGSAPPAMMLRVVGTIPGCAAAPDIGMPERFKPAPGRFWLFCSICICACKYRGSTLPGPVALLTEPA